MGLASFYYIKNFFTISTNKKRFPNTFLTFTH